MSCNAIGFMLASMWLIGAPMLAADPQSDTPPPRPPVPTIADLWREPVVAVGLDKQLLVDDYVVAHRHNIHRDLNQAQAAFGCLHQLRANSRLAPILFIYGSGVATPVPEGCQSRA